MMKSVRRRLTVAAATALCGALMTAYAARSKGAGPNSHDEAKERARIVLSMPLPNMDGDHLKAALVEVHYGPGEGSTPHSHPCAVIGYVVEGAVRTQVKGESEMVYKVGESFYEAPNGLHVISANASSTEPARFVAYFVCDHNAPLSSDVPESTQSKGSSK